MPPRRHGGQGFLVWRPLPRCHRPRDMKFPGPKVCVCVLFVCVAGWLHVSHDNFQRVAPVVHGLLHGLFFTFFSLLHMLDFQAGFGGALAESFL